MIEMFDECMGSTCFNSCIDRSHTQHVRCEIQPVAVTAVGSWAVWVIAVVAVMAVVAVVILVEVLVWAGVVNNMILELLMVIGI